MKKCIICKVQDGIYKCPTCLIYYCSVVCCKKHRESNCEVNSVPPVEDVNRQDFITNDTVPEDKLLLLKGNEELKDMLKNKHLRDLLVAVDNSKDAEAVMSKAMLEPIFVEFADECLKVVEPQED
ncbi:PREDICTED: zinc finger HIT domain-containing protein 3 [Nicrophorus vespilloides]|uniref:Zinc finger HIT domain-containing protein 3 n=1 Tax=Nicrophorus vespilloides TaxID=110193 RepID=A0ABM1N0S5_NICVS|nr:PREDICTED: zinc finger HIT domain-containing protein 3 [Nicrophorus vespilloides]